jgi:hypothetical protein
MTWWGQLCSLLSASDFNNCSLHSWLLFFAVRNPALRHVYTGSHPLFPGHCSDLKGRLYFRAAGTASCGHWCCERRRWCGGAKGAARDRKRCCKGHATVLLKTARDTTRSRWGCYQPWPVMLRACEIYVRVLSCRCGFMLVDPFFSSRKYDWVEESSADQLTMRDSILLQKAEELGLRSPERRHPLILWDCSYSQRDQWWSVIWVWSLAGLLKIIMTVLMHPFARLELVLILNNWCYI